MNKRLLLLVLLGCSSQAYSEGSPWVPGHGENNISLSVTSGSSADFFIGETSTDLGTDLSGTFYWLNYSYGYDDIWAFDVRAGYAEAELDGNNDAQSDFADTSVGVSYQFINEFEADNGLPTISGRLGFTFGGSYDPNRIDAIGDGASGFDVSLLVGKSVTPAIALIGDLTYRQRGSDVADTVKLLLTGYYTTPISGLGVGLSYAIGRTDTDLDFGPDAQGRFSETNRDTDWLIFGADYGFSNGIGLGLTYASLLEGRNIPDTDVGTFTVSYSF